MQDYMYSIISVIALVIHLVINPGLLKIENIKDKKSRMYFFLMISIFFYYITDACWGLFAGLNNIPLLFLDTTVYFVAMAAVVMFWANYLITYLELDSVYSKGFRIFGLTFFCLEIAALAVNFFYPCFFWFDEIGAYQGGVLRNTALWVQEGMFFFTVLLTLTKSVKQQGIMRKRTLAVLFFSIGMFVTSFLQIQNALLPYYAMGCLIGCTVLHVYIVEDEREEYRQVIAREKNAAEAANRAKTSFLFNMSHDIRTPMNAILGYEVMARKKSTDPVVNDYLKKIDIAGNQLLSLVNQVLEMSRIESGKVVLSEQKIDMDQSAEVVRTIYASQAELKGLRFFVDVSKITHRHVIGDSDRVSQIMNNLIGNAIKYTREGGSIFNTVEEEPCEMPGYAVYRMTVEDTGIGMEEEFLPHIFEEFSREETSTVSHIQGTGLGMSIVKRLVDLMNGTIEVTSKPGVGSKFIVRIPLRIDTETAAAPEKAAEHEEVSLQGMKILLVEDNEMNREIAEEILTEAGAEIDTAEDGVIAVGKVEKSEPGQYDVILMDIQMPRMNGYEATKKIRSLPNKELAGIKIIAMTANAFAEDRQNALEAGMNDHLAKPIDVPKLLGTLSGLKTK